jgi:hypothetical protein
MSYNVTLQIPSDQYVLLNARTKKNVTKLIAAKKLVVAKKVHNYKNRRLHQDTSTIGIPDKNGIITITERACFLERCKFCFEILFDARKAQQHAAICLKRPGSKTVKQYFTIKNYFK